MGLWQQVADGVTGVVKGHLVTFRNLFRRPVTYRYPEVRPNLPVGTRGMPVLLSDDEGNLLCTACEVCARECPVQVIHITAHRDENKKKVLDEFDIDMSRCMFCGICAEVCAFGAIAMSDIYELADFEQENLIYNKERLAELGRRRKGPIINYGIKTEGNPYQSPAEEAEGSAGTADKPAQSAPATPTAGGTSR
ncbi:MAG: NADH-quinone oxidoreductase subunit I [Limnochordales bacterium]|nr:NADH-quinone oxidoreductase subunit I [Limnochordales bacterium]